MPAGKGSKQPKSGAAKGKASAAKKTEGKKPGTRVSTDVYVRADDAGKSGGSGSRNKLRDGKG